MATVSLRALARRYADGEISRNDYVRERRELVDQVVAGNLQPVEPSLAPVSAGSAPQEPAPPTARRGSVAGDSGRSRRPVFIAAAVLVLGTVVAAVLLLDNGQPPLPQAGPPAPVPAEPSAPSPAPEIALINGFLAADSWSAESIASMAGRWAALPAEARSRAQRSPEFRKLVQGLHSQIAEAEGLATLGGGQAANERLRELLDFAGRMDVQDSTVRAAAAQLPPAAGDDSAAGPSDAAAPIEQAEERGTAVASASAPESLPTENPVREPVPAPLPEAADAVATAASDAAGLPDAAVETVATPAPAATVPATEAEASRDAAAPAAPTLPAHPDACRAALARSRRPFCRDPLPDGGFSPVMAVVPAGEFRMGGKHSNEQPIIEVSIAAPFAIGVYEVAVGDYRRFVASTGGAMPAQPSNGEDYPVVNVSWHDAMAYTAWLGEQTGRFYRLPTEAEWEYATRAGSDAAYPFGDSILPVHARFAYQGTPEGPLPRSDRTVNKNAFRLYHTVGNVREWVMDGWSGTLAGTPVNGSARPAGDIRRVARGGSWADGPEGVRSAVRTALPADQADAYTGFRVVQEIGRAAAAGGPGADMLWLLSQNADAFTVQLFAVQDPERVESFRRAYPELALRVLPDSSAGIHRLVHGSYDSLTAARAAHAGLPAALTKDSTTPIIKRLGDLYPRQTAAD